MGTESATLWQRDTTVDESFSVSFSAICRKFVPSLLSFVSLNGGSDLSISDDARRVLLCRHRGRALCWLHSPTSPLDVANFPHTGPLSESNRSNGSTGRRCRFNHGSRRLNLHQILADKSGRFTQSSQQTSCSYQNSTDSPALMLFFFLIEDRLQKGERGGPDISL